MKYTYTYETGILEATEKDYFEKMNPGYETTGETLREEYSEELGREGGATTYVVMKAVSGKARRIGTPYGMCRDCGDHYIIARWSRYDRIDKETYKRTPDVEDR